MRPLFLVSLVFFFSCQTTTYFIVRHAEKEQGTTMLSDPPLSAEGEKQAMDLKNFLQKENIKTIYSTNYARTTATAEPTRKYFGESLKLYDPRKPEQLVDELKKNKEGNVLVVGHSNTVDDVVNGLLGENKISDLPDSEYGTIFLVRRRGNSYWFEKRTVPKTTPRTLEGNFR